MFKLFVIEKRALPVALLKTVTEEEFSETVGFAHCTGTVNVVLTGPPVDVLAETVQVPFTAKARSALAESELLLPPASRRTSCNPKELMFG